MLKSLTLKDWKSFGDLDNRLELSPLTLLVGPNASGKSNALDALRFLQGAALDYPLGDVLRGRWEGQREIWPAIRGQVVEAARGERTCFELTTEWDIGELALEHQIEVDTRNDVLLDAERVMGPNQKYAFDTHAPALISNAGRQAGGVIHAALRSNRRGKPVSEKYFASRSLLGQIAPVAHVQETAIEETRTVQRALRNVVFMDILPSRMRDYKPEHAHVLGTSAENISPKLKVMSEEQREDVVGWLGELCAPNLTDISFDTTKLKEVMFFLEEGGDNKISARSVSDGTLRFLGLVTALLAADEHSLIVLEEPDVGLHPARIHLLARLLEQTTKDRKLQVIATTHSPILLAHLSPEPLSNVVALGRAEDGTTIAKKLGALPHFSTLRDSKQLDHLISTGWIERAM